MIKAAKIALAALTVFLLASCSGPTQEDAATSVASPPSAPAERQVEKHRDYEAGGYSYESAPPIGAEAVVRDRATETVTPASKPPTPSFDDVVSQLVNASFAYSWPDRVNLRETFDVTMAVNPIASPEQVASEIGGESSATGTVKISRILIARLRATDFDITPITPERQAVDRAETTRWLWKLKPKIAGRDRAVNLTIVAVVEVGDEKVERFVKTYDGLIYVDVTPKQRFEDWIANNWQWAWTALLVPLFLWGWPRVRRRSSRE